MNRLTLVNSIVSTPVLSGISNISGLLYFQKYLNDVQFNREDEEKRPDDSIRFAVIVLFGYLLYQHRAFKKKDYKEICSLAKLNELFDDEKFVTSVLSKELPFQNVPEERFYEITGIVQNFVNRTINEYIYKLYCIILEYLDAIYGFDDSSVSYEQHIEHLFLNECDYTKETLDMFKMNIVMNEIWNYRETLDEDTLIRRRIRSKYSSKGKKLFENKTL